MSNVSSDSTDESEISSANEDESDSDSRNDDDDATVIEEEEETITAEKDDDSDEEGIAVKRFRRTNGNWKITPGRTFKEEWTELYPWVEEDPNDLNIAICRACNKKIKAHKGVLEMHQKTRRHLQNLSGSDEVAEEELQEKKVFEKAPKVYAKRAPKVYAEQTPKVYAEQQTSNVYDAEQTSKVYADHRSQTSHQTFTNYAAPAMDTVFSDDQFNVIGESAIDSAHQAVTEVIDRVVEQYHQLRAEYTQIQSQCRLELEVNRMRMVRENKERRLTMQLQGEAFRRDLEEMRLCLAEREQNARLLALDEQRNLKLKAIEKELEMARQEFAVKSKFYDTQLSKIEQ